MTISPFPNSWLNRYNDLPLLRVPSMEFPQYDGDMAELHQLADDVLCYPARDVAKLAHRYIYHRVQDATGIYPRQLMKNWDAAAELLRQWRRG